MARQIIDLPRMTSDELEDDDLLLVRDVSAKKDKRIKVQDLGAGGGGVNMNDVFPVGSVRIFADNLDHSTDYGMTWVRFAQGKTLIGIDSSDTDFDTIGETGGSKSHQHDLSSNGWARGAVSSGVWKYAEITVPAHTVSWQLGGTGASASGTINYATALGGKTDNKNALPPYVTTAFWRRTA